MIIEYVKSIPEGYQYKLTLLPLACNLDQSILQNNLKGIPKSGVLSLSFTFRVTKLSANNYQVNLILNSNVYQITELEVSLYYLKGNMIVPKKFIPSPINKSL